METKVYTVFEHDARNPEVPATAVFESTRNSLVARRYAVSMNNRAVSRSNGRQPKYHYTVGLWSPKKGM